MRKFLLAMSAACMLAINADAIYLIGAPAGEWSPKVGIEMTEVDNAWEWTGTIGVDDYFAFATDLLESGDWDVFNSTLRLSPNENGVTIGAGEYPMSVNNSGNSFRGIGAESKLIVREETDGSYTLTVEVLGEIPEPVKNRWSVIGAFSKWEGDVIMQEVADDVWTAYFPTISGEFKFRANLDWATNLGCGNDSPRINVSGDYPVAYNGSNFLIINGKEITITLDVKNMTVKVEGYFLPDAPALRFKDNDFLYMSEYAFTKTDEEGVYSLELPYVDGADEFKVANYYWDTILSTGNMEMKADEDYTLERIDDNMKLDSDYLDAVFTLNTNTNTLSFTGIPIAHAWSIIGEFNNWEGDVEMEYVGAGVWRATLESLKGEFKFRNNKDWTVNFGGKEKPTNVTNNFEILDIERNGENFSVYEAENLTIMLYLSSRTVGFSGSVTVAPEENKMYLIGDPVGVWSPDRGIEILGEDGVWKWTGTVKSDEYFAFATKLGDADDWDTFNEQYRLSPNGDGIEAIGGDYELRFGKPEGSFKGMDATSTYTITKTDDKYSVNIQILTAFPASNPLNKWSLIGEFNNWEDDVEMTRDDNGIYTVKMDKLSGEFKFRANKDWSLDFGAKDETEVKLNEPMSIAQYGNNFSIEETEDVILTLDLDNETLTVTSDSGIIKIENESVGNAVYFNMQGIRIAEPTSGLYIKVNNGKSQKVIVK